MISKLATLPTDHAPGLVQDHAAQQHNGLTGSAPQAHPPMPETSSPSPKRAGWLWLLVFVVAATAWHYQLLWWPWVATLLSTGVAPPPKSTTRIIPVATAIARQRDMDLFLNGLGTATAFKTVTVRSRVEGELIKVHFTEGQMVEKGDVLAEIDPQTFEVQRDQAEGQLARAEATLKLAKLTLDRYHDLLKSNVIAQQQLDDQATLVQQTEGAVQTDRAMVALARLQLDCCQIVAPISGRIGLRLVDQGNIVRANDSTGLAVITQLQPIAVVFTIPQDDISRVQKQMRGDEALTVDAYDRDFRTKLASGKLAAIDNQVDPTTGTLRLKAVFENEDHLLFPNQFVNAKLWVETKRDAIVVPSAAIQRGPASTFVWVVKTDETVELKNVVIGPTEGSETLIESGLTAGEIVVTEGIDKLPLKKNETVSLREKKSEKGKAPGGADSSRETGDNRDASQKGTR